VPQSSRSDIVRAMFAAYRARDRAGVERRFADDFSFTSPYDDRIDKTAYFEWCWAGNDRISSNVIERIFEQGDEAFVTYQCTTTDGEQFRNTEFFRFDGERIRSIDVYFGASYRNGVFREKSDV
jgi:ketosteroid isomerase-like protein